MSDNNWFSKAGNIDGSSDDNFTSAGAISSGTVPTDDHAGFNGTGSTGSTFIKPVKGLKTNPADPVYKEPANVKTTPAPAMPYSPVPESEASRCRKCGAVVPNGSTLCWKCSSASSTNVTVTPSNVPNASSSAYGSKSSKKVMLPIILGIVACLVIVGGIIIFLNKDRLFGRNVSDDYSETNIPNNTSGDERSSTTKTTVKSKDVKKDEGLSQTEAQKKGGVYILRNDRFYSISAHELSYAAFRIDSYDNLGMTYADDSCIPVISLNKGDQLVTFDNQSTFKINPISYAGYCFPIAVIQGGSKLEFSGIGPVLKCEYHTTSFLDNVELNENSNWLDIIEKKGATLRWNFITSDTPLKYTAGYYSGTEYLEYPIETNARFYMFSDTVEIPVQKTKLGYFILDATGIESGKYVINVGKYWSNKYVIQISN